MSHNCAKADCTEQATWVCIETHDLAMLFKSGAGLLCEKHATEMERIGGACISLRAFVENVA